MDDLPENVCSGVVIDAAMHVHSTLGSGLLERAYAKCLAHELRTRGHTVEVEVPVDLVYRGTVVDHALRIDLLVDGVVVVEVKAVEKLDPAHTAQLLTYLQYSGRRVGLLFNFHAPRLKDGMKRVVSTGRMSLRVPSR